MLFFQSAAYIARYVMKKRTGETSADFYSWTDADGVVHQVKPEFNNMSRRPGIGADWIKRFESDVYPHDFIVVNGKKCRPPRFYDNHHKATAEKAYRILKRKRVASAKLHEENNSPERLKVREEVAMSKVSRLKRVLD